MDYDDEMSDVNADSNPNISSQKTIYIPSLSTIQPNQDQSSILAPQTTNVSPPPTLLLDSIILQEVCENIFEDLHKLVKARNTPIHTQSYEDKWTALRERVDTVMCELQKLSIEAQNRLYISDSPFFLDISSIITSSVEENLDLSWVTKVKVKADVPSLEKLQHDSEQEKKIKKLERELFEQKMLVENLKRNMAEQKEEFRA